MRQPTTNIVSGRQLRAARVLAGLTQAQLAQQAGFHERACRYWEAQGDDPPTSTPSSLAIPQQYARVRVMGLRFRTEMPANMEFVSVTTVVRWHGGLSTGPRTVQGRARIAEAQRRRWKALRAANAKSQRPLGAA